jgi:pyrroloquinoline quinone biosynthesis protein B
MRIRLLGTAAGGGVPQWNCNCPVCREARAGNSRVQPRTQSSVAISADDEHWFLLNASPDLRVQIEGFAPLQPASTSPRGSPIEAILLTNADLDHTLGLFLLREGEKLLVHATPEVRKCLTDGIALGPVLASFCGVKWIRPTMGITPLLRRDGSESGLIYQAISLVGRPPRFMKGERTRSAGDAIGYRIQDQKTGGRLLFLPDVAHLNDELVRELSQCEVLLFDGTFWSENEMEERGAGRASASSMGHVPISGPSGSLRVLAELKGRTRVYIHLNNTNPVLLEDSPERAAVTATGCSIGWDGMELVI